MAPRPGSEEPHPDTARPVLLFGAHGGLGSALHRQWKASGRRVDCPAWNDAKSWLDASDRQVRAQLDRFANGGLDILFAGGLTDPGLPSERLLLSNLRFPQKVIAATRDMEKVRAVTFGTIMERFGGKPNPYVASKRALADWMTEEARRAGEARVRHIQLHTLYGGARPSEHMFIGQLVAALRRKQPFAMSAGLQLREYHHVDDVAGAVGRLLSQPSWDFDQVLPLSSGQPIQLATLARAIFDDVGQGSNLRIAALATPAGENLTETFTVAPAWLLEPSREPVAGVCAWVRALLRGT